MKFLFGLGNPEPKYDETPHNVGYATIDRVAELLELSPVDHGTGIRLETGEKIFLCKPKPHYMNESGIAIREMLSYYKVDPSVATLAVVHDDLDMPVGSLRGKIGGGTGGHNGVKSVIEELDTQDFFRIKIGVGRHEHMDPYTYVLSKLDNDRLDIIEKVINRAAKRAIQWLLTPPDKIEKQCQGFKESLERFKEEMKDERDHM